MKNKYLRATFFCLVASLIHSQVLAQVVTSPRDASPAAKVSQTVGLSKITVKYSRPSVVSPNGTDRTGKIYGTNVAHYGYQKALAGFGSGNDFPWRAGANENTIITFSHDAKVEGQDIAAGSYGLFIALNETGGDVIFSSNTSSWGSYFYDEAETVLKVSTTSQEISFTKRLTFNFVDLTGTSAVVALDWENRRFPFKVEFNSPEIVLASMRNELRTTGGFGWQGYNTAANYALSNDGDLEEALKWANTSIGNSQNFNNLSTKAIIQAKMGDSEGSEQTMETAYGDPSASPGAVYGYGRRLIGLDKDKEALVVFEKLNEKWPDSWYAPHGLARAYSALGDYKKALKYEKVALEKAPDGSKGFLEGFIKTLEEGKDFN